MWKNKWLLRIVSIISPLFSLLGVTLFNVSSATYLIILLIWAVIALINMVKLYQINGEIKNNSNKMFLKISQLKDKNDSSDDIGCLEERCLKRVEREKKLYKKRKNTLTDLISIFCIIVLLCVLRFEPINTLIKKMNDNINLTVLFSTTKQSSTNEKEEENKQSSTNEKEEENKQSSTNEKEEVVKFDLKYPKDHPKINSGELELLMYRLFYEDENNLDVKMKSEIKFWLSSKKDNFSLDIAETSSGNSAEYYSNIERKFTSKNEYHLSSDLWEEIISGRQELFKTHPNGSLAWLIANQMQTYALNYLKQTKNGDCVLYFYLESIKNTQDSLEFKMDIKSKHKRIKYLQSRYKDIAECEIINEDIQLKASKIYIAIQEVLDELHIS